MLTQFIQVLKKINIDPVFQFTDFIYRFMYDGGNAKSYTCEKKQISEFELQNDETFQPAKLDSPAPENDKVLKYVVGLTTLDLY